uniref:CD107 antigen-like family member A n=1 Tax=Chlorocebus sabaeus TaxID=60711 RepID=A0A0D9RG20_CHLSB
RLAPWSPRLPLVLLLRGLLHGASAVDAVKKGKGTACIMASFSAAFSMNYDSKGSKHMAFDLPSNADSGPCGKENNSPRLVMGFGGGQTLTFHFPRNATHDGVQLTSFVHSLSDTHIFPSASSEEIKMAESTRYQGTQVGMTSETVRLRGAPIRAQLSNREQATTTERRAASKTRPPSQGAASRSAPPRTGAATAAPTGPASAGLQLSLTERRDHTTVTRPFNVSLRKTHPPGRTVLGLQCRMKAGSSRIFLLGIPLNTSLPDARDPPVFSANDSLRALQVAMGSSYRCEAGACPRTRPFSINMFPAWDQAFRVEGNQVGAAEEGPLDENNTLVPIAVRGALAGLVLPVLSAHLVRRKRSHPHGSRH